MGVLGHLLDDRRLSHPRPFPLLDGQVVGQVVNSILQVMELAVDRLELGKDAVQGLLRTIAIGNDEQVIFGDHVIGQPDLIQEEFQTRFEPDTLELELDGILRLDFLTLQRGDVEYDRHFERLFEVVADLQQ